MGVDRCINLGPYIKLIKIPEIEVKDNFISCLNTECKSYNKMIGGDFCKNCGSKTGSIDIIKKIKIDIIQIMYDTKNIDLFFYYEDKVLIPNQIPSKLKPFCPRISDLETEIPNKEEAISIFKESYGDFMKILDKNGIEYEIKFGILNYYY